MSLEVTPEIEEIVHTLFRTGQYESESQIIHEALNLLRKRDQLRLDIKQGLSEIESGESIEGDEVLHELEERAGQISKAKQ
ncbi:MAG: type II toxin-antitoxin system ParD family antitoxin [Desulfomonile tiedjei]|nr:type II toxin-antitoxin system ParD family antitoxin [Desulfomonile tiedjei]